MDRIRSALLRNRHTLLFATVFTYIVVVVIEGVVMDRDTRVFHFQNPYFDLKINNLEDFQDGRESFR